MKTKAPILLAIASAMILAAAAKANVAPDQANGQTVTQNGVKIEFKPQGDLKGKPSGTESSTVNFSASKKLKLTVPARTPLDGWQLSQLAKAYPSRSTKYVTGLKAGDLGQDELVALLVSNPQSGSVPAKSGGPKRCSAPPMIVTVRELREKITSYQSAVSFLVNVSPDFIQPAKEEGVKLAEIVAAIAPLMDDEKVILEAIDKMNGKFDLVVSKIDALAAKMDELLAGQARIEGKLDAMHSDIRALRREVRFWGVVGLIGDVANFLKHYTTTIKVIKDCGGGC